MAVVRSSISASPRWYLLIAASTSGLVATTGLDLEPVIERMSSRAKTLAGSAMATTQLAVLVADGQRGVAAADDVGDLRETAEPSTGYSVRSTNSMPIWVASAATSCDSVSTPRSTSTRPRLRPSRCCSSTAPPSCSGVTSPPSSRMSPSCFTRVASRGSGPPPLLRRVAATLDDSRPARSRRRGRPLALGSPGPGLYTGRP